VKISASSHKAFVQANLAKISVLAKLAFFGCGDLKNYMFLTIFIIGPDRPVFCLQYSAKSRV
jgi:hypothetical protein